jgi:hypothetical protein
MATEIKKEIQLEIAHVLFIDTVGYSKLSINEQHAAVDELTQIGILVDDFVVALSQLAMNLHRNAHELENLLLVKQLIHSARRITGIGARDTNYKNCHKSKFTRIASSTVSLRFTVNS